MISSGVRPDAVAQLSESIAAALSAFDNSKLEGAVAAALAGEYYGEKTFRIFAAETDERDERRFWQLARDVEALTAVRLEEFLQEAAIPPPDATLFHDLAKQTARVFSGERHREYCRWVTPMISDALESFRALRAMLADVAPELGQQVFDHEDAFASAWQLLSQGFERACAPLRAHLERYGQQAICFDLEPDWP